MLYGENTAVERQVEASSRGCGVGAVNQTPDGREGSLGEPIWLYLAVPEHCRSGEKLSNDNKEQRTKSTRIHLNLPPTLGLIVPKAMVKCQNVEVAHPSSVTLR